MKDTLQICSYRDFLIKYLGKKFPSARKEDIEDAVQNAIIKAIRSFANYQGESSLKTWLTVIATNMYINTFRKNYVKNEYLINSSDDLFLFEKISTDDFSETFCESHHLRELVKDLMSGFVVDDVDYKDIAIQQNIPIGTVKSRVFRGKKLLQEKYREISFKYEDTTV
jgi:RNA polymerase sigma-70 factor (ECF subfamily)